jgi:hypothetical protein
MDNAQVRSVSPQRFDAAWARGVIVLAAGVCSVAASRAEARLAPIVQQYTCLLPIIRTQSVTISVVRLDLDTATVGLPSPRLPVTAAGTAAAAARVVSFLGAEWVRGTAVTTGEVDTPQGLVEEGMRFTLPHTDVATGSGPLSASGSDTLPTMAFSRPGEDKIFVTGLRFHIGLPTSDSGQTFLSPFSTTCTLASGQGDAVASFRILRTPAPALSPDPTRGTAASSPSPRSTTGPAPSPVITSPAPPPPAPTSPPKPSSLTPYLLWPVGMVVVGGLGGAAWWLLRRWLTHRPAR